jgi:3-methyl-2-oxobutanoate hydroxymethyltransferase
VQGRDEAAAAKLREAAREVQDAGADLLVLECVPASLAAAITRDLSIPTIGIGAGVDCDGQVLVMYDLIGVSTGRRPRFVKNFLAGNDSIVGALSAYASEVRAKEFPGPEHSY